MIHATWDSNSLLIGSELDLTNVVNTIKASGEPTMVFLEHANGRTLVVGIGHAESVLSYFEEDGTSFHSIGNIDRAGLIQFKCRDQVDDFLLEMAVPESSAIEAAREFLIKGNRPVSVQWEADW